jgi:plastocyanin
MGATAGATPGGGRHGGEAPEGKETRVMRRTILMLGVLALLAIPAGVAAQSGPILCGPAAGPAPAPQCYSGPTAIEITHAEFEYHFVPPRAFVQAGTTMTWTNVDYEVHTVTADDGSFASGPIAPGEQFSHTFGFAGGFTYHCDNHPVQAPPPLTPRVIVSA